MQISQLDRLQGMPELELGDRLSGAVRYIEHGTPHWRIRWHYHDEYELHLIVAGSGKMFIGDYVGSFEPGCLILTGPRLPHNWVSHPVPGEEESLPLRDRIVHFDHDVLVGVANLLPELQPLLPLLERANHGIEFHSHGQIAERYMKAIKEATGIKRFSHFCDLMDHLACSSHYRLLSTSHLEFPINQSLQKKIDRVVDYVMEHYQQRINLAQVASLVDMNEDYFSRFFRKATGNRFSDFVNRIRISKACDLLSRTDKQVTTICYEVGFNNVANFNRRFYQYKNTTPSEYRQQTRQRYSH